MYGCDLKWISAQIMTVVPNVLKSIMNGQIVNLVKAMYEWELFCIAWIERNGS